MHIANTLACIPANRGADRRRVPRKQAQFDCVVRGVRDKVFDEVSTAVHGDAVAVNVAITGKLIANQIFRLIALFGPFQHGPFFK